MIGIGCIIGGGIFVVAGTAAALHAGPAVLISFVIAALAWNPACRAVQVESELFSFA